MSQVPGLGHVTCYFYSTLIHYDALSYAAYLSVITPRRTKDYATQDFNLCTSTIPCGMVKDDLLVRLLPSSIVSFARAVAGSLHSDRCIQSALGAQETVVLSADTCCSWALTSSSPNCSRGTQAQVINTHSTLMMLMVHSQWMVKNANT